MLKIAILGFGVVGGGVADVIDLNRESIEKRIGKKVDIKYILDLREFPDSPYKDRVVHDFETIAADKELDIAVEAMGGLHPAYDFTKRLLENGVSVVTSNKHVVAEKGAELLKTASEHGARYMFEASVGGGIPVLTPLRDSLAANGIDSIDGILNGTTNYILDQMIEYGKTFEEALKEAQQKGYAEADPTADVEGIDAARKICILNAIATGVSVSPDAICTKGITDIKLEDVRIASEAGYSVKLIGHADSENGKINISVEPKLVPYSDILSRVDGVYNAIKVKGNASDDVTFVGRGAGKMPTASAVVGDVIDIALFPDKANQTWEPADENALLPSEEKVGRYYIRVAEDEDEAGLAFGNVEILKSGSGECAFITEKVNKKMLDRGIRYFASEPLAVIAVKE